MSKRTFKAEGLVLRTRALGEADRLVTLLSWEEGKFEAVARGARKVKSRLASGVDLFTHAHYIFHRGKTWPIITGLDPIERFLWFRENPDLYPYGLYFAELTDRLVFGAEKGPVFCLLLREGWRLLGEDIDRSLLCRAFELKLAAAAGYRPHLQSCARCGSGEKAYFSPRQGGLLCPGCREGGAFRVDAGTLALAWSLIHAPLERVRVIRPTELQKKELTEITGSFYACHLDLGEVKSRRLLEDGY